MPSCLSIRRQGFGSHILVTQDWYVICHWSDKRWWRQSQATISRISACWSWYLNGKLLQAFSLAMVFGYWIGAGWVLLWIRRALSLSLSLFGNAGFWSKGFMLAIDTAGTYLEIICCTLDQWPLVGSATRSIGLWQLILALPILQRISYLL